MQRVSVSASRRRRSGILSLAIFFMPGVLANAQPVIRPVDVPATWQDLSLAAVSGDGLLAGGAVSRNGGNELAPITWTSGGGVNFVDASYPSVLAINADGSVFAGGRASVTAGTGVVAASVTRNGQNFVLNNFDNLPIETRPYGLSSDGSFVVGTASRQVGSIRRSFAARWDSNNQIQAIADIPGATFSRANAVSSDGSVVVGTVLANNDSNAFRWTAQGGTQILPRPTGFTSATALKITGTDSLLGNVTSSSAQRLTRWTSTGAELLPLIQFATGSSMIGSSADGSIIYGTSFFGSSQRRTIWIDSVPYDFKSLLEGLGADTSRWIQIESFSIRDVSADGKTIVGTGLYQVSPDVPNEYQFRSFMITGIPSPGAVSVLAFAGLAVRRRR